MPALGDGLDLVDLEFQGHAGVIATGVLAGPDGIALVDPGPASTLRTLEAGLTARGHALGDVRAVLLTHIHLDHAGASGLLLERCPSARLLVHARGAPHMADPSKLLASAARLYGGDMDRLWGAVLPVPSGRMDVLAVGGPGQPEELTLDVVGHEVRVAWTPGHASHHVSWFLPAARLAFVGDTAGIRRPGPGPVLPATPPPDVDLARWRDSTARILAWEPERLFLTHFGPHADPRGHFDEFWARLTDWNARTLASLDEDGSDDARAARFAAGVTAWLTDEVGGEQAHAYASAGRFDYSWLGLARHGRKQHKAPGGGS